MTIKVAVFISSAIESPNGAAAYVKRIFEHRDQFLSEDVKLFGPYCGKASSKNMVNYSNSALCKFKNLIKRLLSKTKWGTEKALYLGHYSHALEAIDAFEEEGIAPDIVLFNDTEVLKAFSDRYPNYEGSIISIEHDNGCFGQMLKEVYPKVSNNWIQGRLNLQCALNDKIVFVGEGNRRRFAEQNNKVAHKTKHIHLGIDPVIVSNCDEALVRPNLPAKKGRLRLVTTGTVCSRKNQLEIIRAVSSEAIKGMVSLIVLGSGPEYDSAKRLVRQLGLQEYVALPGATSYVGYYLEQSDAYISASYNEGLPTAALEAMSKRLPLIMTYAGSSDEIVRNNGIMIKGYDARHIAIAIEQMLDRIDNIEKMREASFDMFNEYYTTKVMCSEYISLFKETIAEANKA